MAKKRAKVLSYWIRGIEDDIKNFGQRTMFNRYKKIGQKVGVHQMYKVLADQIRAKYGLAAGVEPSEAQWNSVEYKPGKWLRDNNFTKGIFKQIGTFLEKVARIATALPRGAALAALAPFKKAMRKELTRRKIPVSNKLREVADKFYQVVIKNQTNAFETVEPVSLSIIIPAIINFFKALFNKEEPTAEEEEMIKTADEDLENEQELIEQEAKLLTDNPPPTQSKPEFKLGNILMPLLVVIGLYLAWKYIFKK